MLLVTNAAASLSLEEAEDEVTIHIRAGYLDDTYYQYTSLFHSGRLSPSDNKFLIRIRGFSNPDPNFQIDNAREVILAMRDEDFGRNYALNIRIVDCLLADPPSYEAQTSRLIGFIASDFDECEDFLAAYYASGTAVTTLLSRLASGWQGFVQGILASPAARTHVARILSHLPVRRLESLAEGHPELADFLASKLPSILALGIDIAPERLRSLDFEVTDLSALEPHPGFVEMVYERELYELSVGNLEFVFGAVLGIEGDERSRECNYTLVLEAGGEPLLSKVERQFGEYLKHVLLQLPDNRSESVPAILRILALEHQKARQIGIVPECLEHAVEQFRALPENLVELHHPHARQLRSELGDRPSDALSGGFGPVLDQGRALRKGRALQLLRKAAEGYALQSPIGTADDHAVRCQKFLEAFAFRQPRHGNKAALIQPDVGEAFRDDLHERHRVDRTQLGKVLGQLRRMTAPARAELRPLVDLVHRLQFKRETEGGDRIYGMTVINDLRPKPLA